MCLDTSGSGRSEGEYISLGHFESQDLLELTSLLRQQGRANNIALWGRSMGASAALLYVSRLDPTVKAVIVDSPFASLSVLCRELIQRARPDTKAKFPTTPQKLQACVFRLFRSPPTPEAR